MQTVWLNSTDEFKRDFINWYNTKGLNRLYTINEFLKQPLFLTQGIWNSFLLKQNVIILYSSQGASLIHTAYKVENQLDDIYIIKLRIKNKPLINYKTMVNTIVIDYPNSLIPF